MKLTDLINGAASMSPSEWDKYLAEFLAEDAILMEAESDANEAPRDSGIEVEELLLLEEMNNQDSEDDDVYILSPDSEDEDGITENNFRSNAHNHNCGSQSGVNNNTTDGDTNNNITECNRVNTSQTNEHKKRNLSNDDRTQIITRLFKLADTNYKIPRKAISNLATEFCKHKTTIARIWESVIRGDRRGEGIKFTTNMENGGRKRMAFDTEAIKSVPQSKRTTIRQFAKEMEVSPSMIVRLMKRGIIRSHTSSIKPTLKPHHKIGRLQFILRKIIPGTVSELPKFESLTNVVHIDEENFMANRATQRYYLVTEEIEPYRHTQSKNFIEKVMFMVAIARPVFSKDGECLFDGKIGIWPFIDELVAMRSTANRPRGTVITKPARSITKETIREMIIHKLLPALMAKWPTWQTKCIWIQQDNARPHISPDDIEFNLAANKDGFEINLMNQPAQSPDLNILDLGFFNAIQAIQYKKFPNNVVELIKSVEDAYDDYDPALIKFTWLQLQYVMLEIMKCKGGNEYKNPHKGKHKLERIGILPFTVEVPQLLIDDTIKYLDQSGSASRTREEPQPDEVPGYVEMDE